MDFGFGFIPDLLRGKKFEDALGTNMKQGAMAGLAMFGLPALAGAAGTGAATGATNAALIDSAVGTAGYGASSATPAASGGLLAGAKDAMGYVKPISEAAGAANAVGGLFGDDPVQGHAPQGYNPVGAQTLAQLYQQGIPQEQKRQRVMWG